MENLYIRKACGSDVTTTDLARISAELRHEMPGTDYAMFVFNGTLVAKQPAEEHQEGFRRVMVEYNLKH